MTLSCVLFKFSSLLVHSNKGLGTEDQGHLEDLAGGNLLLLSSRHCESRIQVEYGLHLMLAVKV
jgi:hypothetical protein